MKQEIVSGSGISWVICKSAPRSRHITMPAPHYSVFYRPDALPVAQPNSVKALKEDKTKEENFISHSDIISQLHRFFLHHPKTYNFNIVNSRATGSNLTKFLLRTPPDQSKNVQSYQHAHPRGILKPQTQIGNTQ